ncbi:cardiomyopathy-associated protein 5 [Parambassis ranga]|uniref:Cardiomyopathy-associated protein 5 n=1 Tax=Parambassis ranga TaxID=210632 RepID=A0A6P7IZP9_9TELE|nr:cardiomyopathy-associated protein 5-like [Parambassis ranga]
MEECESLEEMTELQEFHCEASDAISQDDEDEVEELQNSLREVVQDQSVKPKLQCLMVDPSFSMVTVQSEDSGIVWETASSRCSTPWASETSSISEACSMEGSGGAGKITIVFDEEKIVRRRTRSGGRSSRLGDRLSRPGSSRSASALGVERPEMMEVSLPNVKEEKPQTEQDLEEIKNKDQQLFSLISEGYEILNIRVPSKLPTVDEEESTELQDNLSYLDQTPKIKSKNHHDWTQEENHAVPEEEEITDQEPSKQASSRPSADTELRQTPTQIEPTTDIDYFEKFTLVDVVVPGEQAPVLEGEAEQPMVKPQPEEQKPAKEVATDSPSASEDSFVFVTDVDIVGEHLDEVFYGEGAPAAVHQRPEDKEEGRGGMRSRRESQRSTKENGAVLFGSEETTLTPIFISPGPPKIIDPILLEEPTAMSFMYSDLYEDAMGERKKSDEEYSEAESLASEKSYKRRFSDSEEGGGYLEKFTLKDETPTVEVQLETLADRREGRMMWAQSDFEMTGCLNRAVEEDEVDEGKTVTEELKTWETDVGEKSKDLHSAVCEEKLEIVAETDKERDKTEPPVVSQEEPVGEDSVEESKPLEENKEDQEVKPPESSTEKPEIPLMVSKAEESEDQQREEEKICKQRSAEPEQPSETQTVAEKLNEVLTEITDETAVTQSVSSVVPAKSETHSEPIECGQSEEAAADTEMAAADEKLLTEASPEEKEPERQETLSSTAPPTAMDTSAGTSVCEEKGAAVEVVPEDCAPVEVITDCDCAVHTVVEVTETAVNEKEIQTQVQIDLQEVTGAETTNVQTPEKESLPEETAADNKLPQIIIPETAASEQELEVKGETSKDAIKPEELDTESEKQQKADSESDKTANTGTVVQDIVNVGDELILIVPKGKAVEMDIQVGQWSEKTDEDTAAVPEPESICDLQAPVEETQTGPQIEVEPEVAVKEEVELPREPSPPPPVEEVDSEEQKMEPVLEEDKLSSPLRSFTAQEDLSALHGEDTQPQETAVEQTAETMEDAPETDIIKEDVVPFIHLQEEDVEQKMELGQVVPETPEVPADELGFEVISEQDAKQMPEPETLKDEEKPKPEEKMEIQTEEKQVEESEMEVKREDKMEVQKREGGGMEENTEETMEVERKEMEMEVMKEDEMEVEEREEKMEVEKVDLLPEEEPIEADYEIIDAEEESEARLAAELEGMDWFCLTCECLLTEDDCVSGEHQSHEVKPVDTAYEEIKGTLSSWISELQERSETIEDLVSELELAYNSVEDQCVESEAAMQAQNDEMMALVMEQYNSMSVSMEEEKKAKLEQLYDQIVSFQESIDSAKATLETTAREAETDARSPEDIHERLKAALDSTFSLELGPKGLLVFEDYAKANSSSSNLAQRKGIPVPQRPTLQHQEPGSATSTSVTVYWKVNPGDIIDCFQVYCMGEPQGAVSEEYRVTVKESYCVLEELEPDKMYKVWVMAVNYTGCSLPSERLTFRTAPSVPAIDTDRCTVMWDSATLSWSSEKQTPSLSYTLEYCRQYELEGEGLRSISGIRVCEQKLLLQPNENYLFYIKAVNEAGSSEQSEAALISTKGTRFHLLKESAHSALELSQNQTSVHYSQDAPRDQRCPSILGELLPAQGLFYWEVIVSGSTAYRLGVAYSTASRDSPLGENSLSWCLQCVPTPSGCRYQLLHNHVQSTVYVMEMPERVGTLLDYQHGCLSFYNAQSGQLLGTFRQHFTHPCHPALALELPGSLEVRMVQEVPEFTKDS